MEALTTAPEVINLHPYKFELSTNVKGKPVARFLKLLSVGKNKGQYKQLEGFYFESEERRQQWIDKKIATIKEREEDKETEKKRKEEAKADHPFKVGDILYQSWGYDQTNIDFYQITAVLNKSVRIRGIKQTRVREAGFMAEYVKPIKDFFRGEESTHPIKVYLWNDKPHYCVSNGRHSLTMYTDGEKGTYQSHYA
jgi:hypothetical protein